MEDGAYAEAVGRDIEQASFRIFADPDSPFGPQRLEDGREVPVAGGGEERLLAGGELVRRPVAARLLHEDQRAVVEDEVVGEELIGRPEALPEEAPEASAAHLGARAAEALDEALGVLLLRLADMCLDSHPVPDSLDLPEGDSDL